MADSSKNLVMEGVKIIYVNFQGREGPYNMAGDRNFSVLLDKETGEQLEADGWNVKWMKPREDDDPDEWVPTAHLSVSAKWPKPNTRVRPPKVVLVTESRGMTVLSEDQVEMIDWADIINVDLIVRPYEWSVNGATGIKAYLQDIYVTIDENPLEAKYNEKYGTPKAAQPVAGVAEAGEDDVPF